MGFSFLHFIGNFGDTNNQDEEKNRHGVLGFLESTGEGVVNSAVRAAKTAADLPVEAGKDLFFLGKAGVQGATGDSQGASNTLKELQKSQQESYINREYGSSSAGDTHGIGNALGLGLDVATAGSGSILKSTAKTAAEDIAKAGAEKSLAFLSPTINKVGTEALKGAGLGAAYGADNALVENKPQDIIKGAEQGALIGGATGGVVGAAGVGVEALKKNATVVHAAGPETFADGAAIPDSPNITPEIAPRSQLKPGVDETPAGQDLIDHLKAKIGENGLLKDIQTTDKEIRGGAPTGVDPTTRTLVVNTPMLESDIEHLKAGKGIQVTDNPDDIIRKQPGESNSDITNRYLNHVINFEERHAKNVTIGQAEDIRNGVNDVGTQLDNQAVQQGREANGIQGAVDTTGGKMPDAVPPVEPTPNQTEPPIEPPKSALEELQSKIVKGIPDKQAIKLSDINDGEIQGKAAQAASSVYSKLTKGDDLTSRISKVKTSLYSKYTPITDFSEKYQKLTGETLSPENDPSKLASLSAGAEAKFKARVDQLDNAVKSVGADPETVKQLGLIDQMLTDRSGVKNPLSQQRLSQARAELEATVGTEAFTKAEKAVQNVRNIQREMLDYMGSVIGKDAVERISEKNPNYFTKFDAVDHLIDNQENIKLGSSFNHAAQDFLKSRGKGFEGNVADPFESTLRQWGKVIAFVESNKVGQAIGKMADNLDKTLGNNNQLAIKIRNESDVKEYTSLSLENKEMRPAAKRLERLMSTRERWGRKLYSEVAKLEQEGLDIKLGQTKETPKIKGEAFRYENRDALRGAESTNSNRGVKDIGAAREISGTLETNLRIKGGANTSQTRALVNSLIDLEPKEFTKVKNKLELRDSKLSDILGEVEGIRNEAQGIRQNIKSNREDMHTLADKKIPEGYEKISYFKNGVKEEVALPKEVADAMKNLNAKQADFITKTASLQSRVLRTGATSLNIAFIPKNIIRDFQTASVNTQHQAFKDLPINWVKAFGDAWVGGPTTKAFIDSGGGQAGFFSRGAGNIEKIAGDVGKSRDQKIGETITDPVKLVKTIATLPFKALTKIGETAELAPRLAEFKAAKTDGLSNEAAAHAGRNITVDFAQAGELGQIANQWVPFLNARLQGNVNIFKAIKRDPARASAVIATTMVAPVVATYLWNRQNYSDVYDQIPDYVKQGNFVMVYGDEKDDAGNFTQVIKIPKGEVGQIFGNPLENLLDYAYGHNPESLTQIAVDTASQASPISFSRKGEIDPGLALSSVLPPLAKGTLENEANFSFFRGAPVVSDKLKALPNNEQVDKSTSPAARFIGAVTGQSPLKIDNLIQSTGGGLGQQLANPTKFATAPTGSFKGASSNEVDNQFYSVLDKTSPLRASASKKINAAIQAGELDTAQSIADNYNSRLRSAFKPFVKEYGHLANQDMVDTFQKQKINLTSATISQRAAAIRAAKKKQQHAQEMAGAITS